MYKESKATLDKIRDEYACKGEVLFRASLQYVIECGHNLLRDQLWVQTQLSKINANHDEAEKRGKVLWITRDFEKAIVECAAEIAEVPPMDMLQYVQKEIWLGGDGMDYQRAIHMLRKCMDWIEDEFDKAETLDTFQYLGFEDEELEELGFGYMIEEEEEE